mgnify:CR=1 FL=1
MKQRITSSLHTLIADRYILSLLAVFWLICLGVLIFLAISIQPSELQVVVHYTSYGATNFYRDKWYYLISFAAYIVIIAILHSILTFKLLSAKGRDIAVAFIWLSIVIVTIAAALFYQILKVASLS